MTAIVTRGDAARSARYLMLRLAGSYRSTVPLAVNPTRGAYGSPEDWDIYTSKCDARIALVLALGRRPDPCTGHVLAEIEQLALFGEAA